MALLIISLLAVVAGPLLYGVADRARTSLVALDGFVLMSVTGLVIVHIIPHAMAAAGAWALAPAVLGFLVPGMVERSLSRAARQAHVIALVVALGGLLVHAFFDGVALATPAETERGVSVLALAVAIHRLPVAITTWALVRPSYGTGLAVAILAGDAAAVTCGYLVQGPAGLGSEPTWVHYFEALVGGSLMHVLIHRPTLSRPNDGRERAWAGLAGVAAVVAVAALSRTDAEMHAGSDGLGSADYVMALARETAPALLAAFALATVVQVIAPRLPVRWLAGGPPAAAPLRGIGYGLTLPICSCGVTPMYRTLIEQGVPVTAALAFLAATPQLGLDAILVSFPLLGGDLALARIVGALAAALLLAALLGRRAPRPEAHAHAGEPAAHEDLGARLIGGVRFGFAE
ncbi:MAG TPA: permease, partial [Kofleriaceae bacterium]|nr:permease [Kofleriaceae bacterium]